MPRTLVRAPEHVRSRSLGWLSTAWMEHFVRHGPGGAQGMPIRHGDEYTGFVVDCYALGENPSNDHRLYDSVFLSRPKGTDKSGIGARLALFEALGPCRFAGWARGGEVFRDPWNMGFRYVYEPGEPMGKPVLAPVVRCMATEEGQVANVYTTIYFNLTDEDCLLSRVPGVDAGLEKVILPWGGEIRVSTASASSKDGQRPTFVVFDESHLYSTPELRRMYDTMCRNLRKRKGSGGTWYIETTTMFAPGEDSIAEKTYAQAEALREGRLKVGRHRLLYDHRWGECVDLANEPDLRRALREAFGEAMSWQDEDGLVDEFMDLRSSPANSRRYFLNAQTSTADAWLASHEWNACGRPELQLRDRDLVTLGFDGAVRNDSTAVVACRVSDGHLELLGCWQKPEGAEGEDWQVDREAVDACVAQAMRRFEVVGFYGDPAHWQDSLDVWSNEYAEKMQVAATAKRPLEWWTNRPTAMISALERFHEAVLEQRVTFTPAADRVGREAELAVTFSRQILNTRRREHRLGLTVGKDHPHSSKKIDAAIAAVLAYEATCDARAKGVRPRGEMNYRAKRIR